MADWMAEAKCRGMDPDLFFPTRNGNSNAKEVCTGCAVREACLEYALAHGIEHGIWGGYGDRTRRKMRRQRAQAATGG